ncbi:hypothetical protein Cadr_000000967 [Camelus dromedarius]|uniref:Uncharacterized protein n=1 Tax=Camelus dromedarius TaxID=9838 RepID=A0A5N4EJ91_CAMDR|nr:hypothetical protein Cadr_000000967 [Camelus dromedarius]
MNKLEERCGWLSAPQSIDKAEEDSGPSNKPAQIVMQAVEITCFSPEGITVINVSHLRKMSDANVKSSVSGCLQLQSTYSTGSCNKENAFCTTVKALSSDMSNDEQFCDVQDDFDIILGKWVA